MNTSHYIADQNGLCTCMYNGKLANGFFFKLTDYLKRFHVSD